MTRSLALAAIALTIAGLSGQAPGAQQRPDPKTVRLRGNRFKPLTYDEMTPAQRTMIEHVLSGPRGSTDGPFNVQLRSPEMGDLGQQFGAATRFATTVISRPSNDRYRETLRAPRGSAASVRST